MSQERSRTWLHLWSRPPSCLRHCSGGLQETLWPLAPQTLSFPPYIVPLSFQPLLLLFLPHTSLFFTLVLLYNLPPSVLPLPVCRHRQKPSANMKELCSCWR